jgi:hypothetical protein
MHRIRTISLLGLPSLSFAAAPPVDPVAAGQVEVLEAIPFRCDEPWTHHWSAERPAVEAGTILVVRVEPEALRPRAVDMPLLMVGDDIAELVNPGNRQGLVIAVVPAPAGWTAGEVPSLAGREVFLSKPGLPDRIDAAERKARREAARAAGVAAQPPTGRVALRSLADRDALDRELAALVRRRCPEQSRLADLLDGSAGSETARPVAPPATE